LDPCHKRIFQKFCYQTRKFDDFIKKKFKKVQNQKNNAHTDEFLPKKVSAHP
jgi:hypothetical protein